MNDTQDTTMTLGSHLDDMRNRLVFALLGTAAAGILTFTFGRQIVHWLCIPLMDALRAANLNAQAHTFSPITALSIYIKVSLIAALILASPWVIYQIWRFFEAGLYPKERKAVLLLAPFSAAMTTLGILFMYYAMLPVCLWFLITFATSYPPVEPAAPTTATLQSPAPINTQQLSIPTLTQDPPDPAEGQLWISTPTSQLKTHLNGQNLVISTTPPTLITPLFEIGQYISFVSVLAIGIVIAFQTPVIMTITGWSGLVDPDLLARYRKHCVMICFAIGMLLTPADVFSMMMLALPLWGLFEFGLILMRLTYRRSAATPADG